MSGSDTTERQLVQRVRDGDPDALRLLFSRHESTARARIRRKLPPALRRKVDPEDILQDACLVAAQRFPTFEGRHEGSFGSWFGQIVEFKTREAVRHFLDADKRSAHREVTRGGRPDTHQFRGRHTTPSQAFAAGELRVRAAGAMASLPEDYRRVIELVQAQGLTLQQAAVLLGRSHAAVKKLHARALARLRQLMDLDRPDA